MADAPIIHIGENSAEHVAFQLFREVAVAEAHSLRMPPHTGTRPDRKWILDTYAECLIAVRNPEGKLSS